MKRLTQLDLNSNKIVNLGAPTNDTDASTKKYVDDTLAFYEPIKGNDDNYVTNAEKADLHAPHSDDQDLSGLVPYTGATGNIDLNGVEINNVTALRGGVDTGLTIEGGISTDGSPGAAMTFKGANGGVGDMPGGDIEFAPGSGAGTGADGLIKFVSPVAGGIAAVIDPSNLTTNDKTFTLPDKDGTIVLLDDITNVGPSAPDAPADGMLWWDTDDTTGITSGNADTVDNFNASATPAANTLLALDANALIPNTALGTAWYTWVPAWTNLNVGNGVLNYAKYTQIGKTVKFKLKFVWGSTTSCSGTVAISLPVTAHPDEVPASGLNIIGLGNALDAGTTQYSLQSYIVSTTTMNLGAQISTGAYTGSSSINASIPMVWTVNDCLTIRGEYESV